MSVAYSALTSQQQALLQNLDIMLRSTILSARKTVALMRAYDIAYNDATLQAAFTQLDSTQLIPTSTGLAGAVPVPGSQYTSQDATMQQLLAAWDTAAMRALHASICGPVNIDGQV